MGEVYLAEDLRLGQTVSLKFLPPGLSSEPRMMNRLVNEVRVGRAVSHPNVCRFYDLVESDGQRFVAGDEVRAIHLQHALPRERPSKLAPDLGPTVEDAILRCLESDPGRRPSAVEVAATLPGAREATAKVTSAPFDPSEQPAGPLP
jgi:serine/threonine protein kinase